MRERYARDMRVTDNGGDMKRILKKDLQEKLEKVQHKLDLAQAGLIGIAKGQNIHPPMETAHKVLLALGRVPGWEDVNCPPNRMYLMPSGRPELPADFYL